MARVHAAYAQKLAADCGTPLPAATAGTASLAAAAPLPAAVADNPGAKFLASVPCDAEGKPLVGSKGTGADIGEEPKPSIGKPR